MLLIPHLSSLFPGVFERGLPVILQALYVHLEKVFVYWGWGGLVLSPLLLFDSGRTLWMKRETMFGFCFFFFFNGVCAIGKASAVQGRSRIRIRKPKGEEMDELLRRPKSRHRSSCWPMTEKKMLNRARVCQVFLTDLLANGSFWVEGKRQGPCLQGCSMQEGQSLFPTNLISINLTHQKSWSRNSGI